MVMTSGGTIDALAVTSGTIGAGLRTGLAVTISAGMVGGTIDALAVTSGTIIVGLRAGLVNGLAVTLSAGLRPGVFFPIFFGNNYFSSN